MAEPSYVNQAKLRRLGLRVHKNVAREQIRQAKAGIVKLSDESRQCVEDALPLVGVVTLAEKLFDGLFTTGLFGDDE